MFRRSKDTNESILTLLADLVREQNKLLLSFHKAGRDLAIMEVEKAKLDVQRVEAETSLIRAEAERRRAEARATASTTPDNPPPTFGERGHTRTVISG
jgi:hypothetical protein